MQQDKKGDGYLRRPPGDSWPGRTASLRWSLRTRENSIYTLLNTDRTGRKINACVNQMGMYYHNTPFERG